ncbi:hypothetical protein H4R19_001531 [Coemansia spiralis]|nr:hypothetical protein H4R19_001531 [Coemansia spiralis]
MHTSAIPAILAVLLLASLTAAATLADLAPLADADSQPAAEAKQLVDEGHSVLGVLPQRQQLALPDLDKVTPFENRRMFAPQFFGMPFGPAMMPFPRPQDIAHGINMAAEGMGAGEHPESPEGPEIAGEQGTEDKNTLRRRWYPYPGYYGEYYPYNAGLDLNLELGLHL